MSIVRLVLPTLGLWSFLNSLAHKPLVMYSHALKVNR